MVTAAKRGISTREIRLNSGWHKLQLPLTPARPPGVPTMFDFGKESANPINL